MSNFNVLNEKLHEINQSLNLVNFSYNAPLEIVYNVKDSKLILSDSCCLYFIHNNDNNLLNIKVNDKLEILELYVKIIDNSIEYIIPDYKEKLFPLKDFPFTEDTFCSYSVKLKKPTEYYSVDKNNFTANRYSFDGSNITRHYILLKNEDELKKYSLDFSELDNVLKTFEFSIAYFEDDSKNVTKFAAAYFPNENFDDLLRIVNLY